MNATPDRYPSLAAVPEDLRLWLGEDRLLQLVLTAASEVASAADRRHFQHAGEAFDLGQLLAILAYAYLTGRYSSEEIAEQLEADPVFAYLCASRYPDAAALRVFRRLHRQRLEAVLRRVLEQCLTARRQQGWLRLRCRPAVPTASGAAAAPDADASCHAEANYRLDRAVFCDTMALDL